VVVALADPTGSDATRALTDAEGHFVLRAPGAGTYRVTARLVGWRPWSSPPIALAVGQTLHYRIENPLNGISLPELRVEAVQRCKADSESGPRIAQLWEETQLALTVLSWTQREEALRVRWNRYDRRLHPRSLEVLEEVLVAAEGLYAGSPFVSRPGEDLAEQGYVRQDSAGAWEFLAPDADALLSDAFVRDHCFHLVADSSRPGLGGLGFQPLRGAGGFDIEGTIWIDTVTAELQQLDYRYTRLPWPQVRSKQAGGRLEFDRLPTGAWIVRRWYIRMPIVEVRWKITDLWTQPDAHIVAFREVGGAVGEVRTREGERIPERGDAILMGIVYDSTAGRPLGGASVALARTAFTTVTDSEGRFRFEHLPTAAYHVVFEHPVLDSVIGVEPTRSVYVGAGRPAEIVLAVPPRERMRSRMCPGIGPGDPIVGGMIRSAISGAEVAGAVVTISWRPSPADSTHLARVDVTSDATGRYVLCGAPTGRSIEVRASDGAAAQVDAARLARGALVRVDLTWR
jgi:hypothetical protein